MDDYPEKPDGGTNDFTQIDTNFKYGSNTDINNISVPIGGIIMWNSTVLPNYNWAFCDGTIRTVICDRQTVKSIKTPNLQDRFVLGYNTGEGGNTIGSSTSGTDITGQGLQGRGGEARHILTKEEMPSHKHEISINRGGVEGSSGDIQGYIKTGDESDKFNSSETGGELSHNNLPPYIILAYIMRIA